MAVFTGTGGVDVADANDGTLTGFAGGTVVELQDTAGDTFIGGDGSDIVVAGNGHDIIRGGLGDDILRGNAGDDIFAFSSELEIGADQIDGGGGSDTIQVEFAGTADFSTATIWSAGISSIERLVLAGGGDHEVIFDASQVATDRLSPALLIIGDAGTADFVIFNNASDLDLSGIQFSNWSPLSDRILINGTAGDDLLVGTSEADRFLSEGNGDGADTIFAGAGNDVIYSSAGADIMHGEAGNDTFAYVWDMHIAGDTIDGGMDAGGTGDRLQVAFPGIADFTTATILSVGTTSIEYLELSGFGLEVRFNASQVSTTGLAPNLTIRGDIGCPQTVTFNNASTLDISAFNFVNWDAELHRVVINGTAGDDIIVGSAIAETFFATADGGGADTILAGGGDDLINGSNGADVLHGGAGNDVFAYLQSDQIDGDTIDGGSDSDTVEIRFSGMADFTGTTIQSIERIALFGDGHELRFNAAQVGGTGLAANLAINGVSPGADTLRFLNASNLNLSAFQFTNWDPLADRIVIGGTAGSDTIAGTRMADIIDGVGGSDTMAGGNGDDVYHVYSPSSVITEGSGISSGIDLVYFTGTAGQTYTLTANVENLTLLGSAAVHGTGNALGNLINGNGAANILNGADGSDIINGGGGSDFIVGGSGGDTMDGDADFDTVSWLGSATGATVHLNNQVRNAGAALGDTLASFENYYLTEFADIFTANDSGGYVYGFGGADMITGGAGVDFIDGGTGGDTLNGGSNFDYVSWNSSAIGVSINLNNQASNAGGALGDTVSNFEAYFLSEQPDIFIGINNGSSIVFGGGGGDTLTDGTGSNAWLFGGEGADVLYGGSLNDLLSGEGGNDTYVYRSWIGEGFDSILNFASGSDRFQMTASGFGMTAGTSLDARTFIVAASPFATTTAPTFLYSSTFGILYFDPDGAGSAIAPIALAQITGAPPVTATDFVFV